MSCACAENTNLTSIEQPQTASANLVEFTYESNVLTSGDIPEFLGSLTNLTTLNFENNGFNGSIPGEALTIAHPKETLSASGCLLNHMKGLVALDCNQVALVPLTSISDE